MEITKIEVEAKLIIKVTSQEVLTEENRAEVILGVEQLINELPTCSKGGLTAGIRIHIKEERDAED